MLIAWAPWVESGIAPGQAGQILSTQVTHEIESLGKDQMQNYFYTYIMVFALYMVIMLYGQMVATNVASEKSSRAMEMLITSAKPTAMMFGKVIASCTAGFIQLLCVFGAALVCFHINQAQWADNPIVCSIFNMAAPSLLGYMLVFFLLGFFIYAFLYGCHWLDGLQAGGYEHVRHAHHDALYHRVSGGDVLHVQREC